MPDPGNRYFEFRAILDGASEQRQFARFAPLGVEQPSARAEPMRPPPMMISLYATV